MICLSKAGRGVAPAADWVSGLCACEIESKDKESNISTGVVKPAHNLSEGMHMGD